MTNNIITIAYDQRPDPGGTVNYVDVEFLPFKGRDESTMRVEFQHVGVDRVPEPVVLDGYVFGLLLLAIERADRLVVKGPISAKALRNAHLLSEAWHCWLPDCYRPINIEPEKIIDDDSLELGPQPKQGATAIAAFSGGADSSFTALRHAGGQLGASAFPVKDLLMVHGFDVDLERENDFMELVDRTRPLVNELGANLHVVRTNIKKVSGQNWEHSFAAQLSCVLHQFSSSFRWGLVGSSEPYSHLVAGLGSHPATDYLLSGGYFDIIHDGAGFSRTEKIVQITRTPTAIRSLKVCWEGEQQGRNCGRCEKCIRTRLNFLAAGLKDPECFTGSLELSEVTSLNVRNEAQLAELQQILDYADHHGAEGEWLSALQDRIVKLKNEGTLDPGMCNAAHSPSADFGSRLLVQQSVVTEFVRRIGPVWLLTQLPGNIGDHLIWAGTERLLAAGGLDYKPISKNELEQSAGRVRPGTLVIPGSGALTSRWCEWLPDLVLLASGVFERIVILPSEYEPHISVVRRVLAQPNVYAFAREVESFAKIKTFGRAALAPDPALWAREFMQTAHNGRGDENLGKVLVALRTDAGSLLPAQALRPAPLNDDVSLTTTSLEEFLQRIGAVDTVVTDRLHVVVGAVMLGKNVRFVDPCSNKISRYIRYNFQDEFAGRVKQRNQQWLIDQGFAESFQVRP